jgi:diaminopimelate decarboxylase
MPTSCVSTSNQSELVRLERIAASLGRRARVSFRVNPDVDAGSHPYISTGLKENKFGIPLEAVGAVYARAKASPHLHAVGIDVHIGSQITEVAPFVDALERTLETVDMLDALGTPLEHIDLGGGLGIRYRDETPPPVRTYLAALFRALGDRPIKVLLEPGRALVGNAGILLTRVEYLKLGPHKNFCVVDAAMNDLMRPALYDAWHDIQPATKRAGPVRTYDVVGPVCESGDFLGRDRALAVAEADLLAVLSAGAYGMSMSSNYNSRARAAEVLIDGTQAWLIRERETVASLFANEHIPP